MEAAVSWTLRTVAQLTLPLLTRAPRSGLRHSQLWPPSGLGAALAFPRDQP